MRLYPPETVLLRIRAETLRLNLERAHAAFKNLPNLSIEFAEVEKSLSTMQGHALSVHEKVSQLRESAVRRDLPDIKAIKDAQDCVESIVNDLGDATLKLRELGNKSFLTRIKEEGQNTWKSLNTRAGTLQAQVKAIENNLSDPNAWKKLADAEEKANNLVFNESIELLGGIALRDTRLDANICELADALIRSIPYGNHPNVIPGSISPMMMTIERFIRLRFPEWTIWGLPFAAHELWRVSVREQFDSLLAKSFGSKGSKLVEEVIVQQCVGDAFAAYIMGPAYAFAAVTLLFNPLRAQDDCRVLAIMSMLRRMDNASPDAFSDSYQTIADDLVAAWRTAQQRVGVTGGPSKSRVVTKVVATLFEALNTFGFSCFDVAEWKPLKRWAEKLHDDAVETIEIAKEHDLRHALNAAWLARLNTARTADISLKANRLADRVKDEVIRRLSDRTPGQLRGLR